MVNQYGILEGIKSPHAALTAGGMAHEHWRFTMHSHDTPSPADRTFPHSKRIRIDDSILTPSVPRSFIDRWNFDPADSFNILPVISTEYTYSDDMPLVPVVHHTGDSSSDLDVWAIVHCPFCGEERVVDDPYGIDACFRTHNVSWKIPVTCTPNDREMAKFFPDCTPRTKVNKYSGVYLIKAANRYKIGISGDVDKRVTTIATSSPFPVEIIHIEPTADYEQLERFLHREFSHFRVHREWFEFPRRSDPRRYRPYQRRCQVTTDTKIANLNKIVGNVQNARNPQQRQAAGKFLVQRANDLNDERKELATWLQEADQYIAANSPEINADAGHEYNVQWIEKLREYEAISNALDSAWSAYMGTMEAA